MKTMPMIWGERVGNFRNPCAACSKELKEGSEKWFVHVINGGSDVLHPSEEATYQPDGGDMDFHAVGSECRKKFGDFAVKL